MYMYTHILNRNIARTNGNQLTENIEINLLKNRKISNMNSANSQTNLAHVTKTNYEQIVKTNSPISKKICTKKYKICENV